MGHRKHSQPRRGSLAYLPRGRAKSMESRIRKWPNIESDEPKLLAHAGFKAGCVQIVSIDDREKTPNHGKQLVSLGTVIVTPPIVILGIRCYSKNQTGKHVKFDVYADNLPKQVSKFFKLKTNKAIENEKKIKKSEILSPTFNIVFEYEIKEFTIKHFDLYRLKNDNDIKNIGLYENLEQSITLIEWPELIKNKPQNRLDLFFEYKEDYNERSLIIKTNGRLKIHEFQ